MNTAAILVPSAFFVLQFNYWVTFPFLYYDDRVKAVEQQCHPDCFSGLITTRLYPVALVASMVMSLWWGKKLPRHRCGDRTPSVDVSFCSVCEIMFTWCCYA